MKNKFKYFKNVTDTSADFYLYGTIVDYRYKDYWTGEEDETEIDVNTLKKELEELVENNIKDFNIYINSGGGSVFAASTMVSLLKRFRQESGVKIHSYIDGLCASAATYLAMVADEINVYQNSIMMIHKPMTFSIGNADELRKSIDQLDTIENNMMIPMYVSKSKVDKDTIQNLVDEETWFSGNEEDEKFIGNYFDINYIDKSTEVTASVSKDLFKNYAHVPKSLKEVGNKIKEQKKAIDSEPVEEPNYSYMDMTISSLEL